MNTIKVVAIDGPVGVGKSTVARRVAERLEFRHLDTGAMYRAVTLKFLALPEADQTPEAMARIARGMELEFDRGAVFVDGEDVSDDIRDEEISRQVARIADNPEVREALVEQQRRIGRKKPSVMEGRDIGTVVFPDAQWKIFLDASPAARADRRAAQHEAAGRFVPRETIMKNLLERDRRDREREKGGLRIAEDAVVVDSTGLDEDTVVKLICAFVRET